jgi:hypothetical protein
LTTDYRTRMRNTSLWIAASLAAAIFCSCKSKQAEPAAGATPAESKPAAGATPAAGAAGAGADRLGTFTCKSIRDESAAGSNSPCVDSTDRFEATVPVVHVTYTTPDLPKSGDAYVIQWIATDVGQAAPANTVIATVNQAVPEVPAAAKSYTVNSFMTKPTNGWPVGKYRVEIKLGDKLATTAQFSIQ